MYELILSTKFKRDIRKLDRQGKDIKKVDDLLKDYLSKGKDLPPECRDHPLYGNWQDHREFHIGGKRSDWVVIYKKSQKEKMIYLIRTGSHSELFN